MIANQISTLLGTRREHVTDLATGAGIAYNTAYRLYRGTTTRVDLETLDKLCRYFQCQVCDLLVYVPAASEQDQRAR